jgi:hypothetical protein
VRLKPAGGYGKILKNRRMAARFLAKGMFSVEKRFSLSMEKIKTHFQYSWWKYALIVILGVLGWNLVHTVTRYQSPEHLKVEFYYCGFKAQSEKDINQLMDELHQTLLSDMEEVTFTEMVLDSDSYSEMTLFVRAVSGEGDVYLLDKNSYQRQGAGLMMDLTPYVESGEIQVGDIDLSGAYVKDPDTGMKELAGIPAASLTKFQEYGLYHDGMYLCMPVSCENVPNAIKLINYFLAEMK